MKTTIEVPTRRSIPVLGDDNTAAEYQAALDVMHEHMNEIALRQGDLRAQEDEAMFGKGDLAEVQKQMNILAIEFGTLQRWMDGAERRLAMAKTREADSDARDNSLLAHDLSAELTAAMREFRRNVEVLRTQIFAIDDLDRRLVAANMGLPESLAAKNTSICFREAAPTTAEQPEPARIRSHFRSAVRVLDQFQSPGGPLFNEHRLERLRSGPFGGAVEDQYTQTVPGLLQARYTAKG